MPRDVSGNYTLPSGVNPVVNNTLIDVAWANPTLSDIATQLNNVLTRDGLLGPILPLKLVDGTVGAPALCFGSQPTTGFYKTASGFGFGISGVNAFTVDSAGFQIPGTLTTNSDLTIGKAATGAAALQIGDARSVAGVSYIDLVSNTGSPDYNARIIRQSGANSALQIINTGTDRIDYLNEGSAAHIWYSSSVERLRLTAGGELQVMPVGGGAPSTATHTFRSTRPPWYMSSGSDVTRAQGLDSVSINIAPNDFNFNSGYSYRTGEIYTLYNNDSVGRRIYKSADISMYIDGISGPVSSAVVPAQTFAYVWFLSTTACIVSGKNITS